MKKYLLLTTLLFVSPMLLFSQNNEPKNKELKEFHLPSNSPLLIISAEDKSLQYPEVYMEDSATIKQTMDAINPDWIQSVEVFKGKEATDKYGSLAQNGAIFITLKKGTFFKMPVDVRAKFKGQ